MTEGGQAGR